MKYNLNTAVSVKKSTIIQAITMILLPPLSESVYYTLSVKGGNEMKPYTLQNLTDLWTRCEMRHVISRNKTLFSSAMEPSITKISCDVILTGV